MGVYEDLWRSMDAEPSGPVIVFPESSFAFAEFRRLGLREFAVITSSWMRALGLGLEVSL